MPTYDYVCSKCDHHFELFQSMKDKALTVCPKDKCGMKRWGKGTIKRALGTGAGIIFKGSGFYTTDYRSDSYKEGAKKDKLPSTETKKTESKTSSETKPAAKSEPKKSGGEKTS